MELFTQWNIEQRPKEAKGEFKVTELRGEGKVQGHRAKRTWNLSLLLVPVQRFTVSTVVCHHGGKLQPGTLIKASSSFVTQGHKNVFWPNGRITV